MTAGAVEISGLEPKTTYAWRIRYRDTGLAWSPWSNEGTFFTRNCSTDLDGDGVISVADLVAVIVAWGATGGPADVDGDGVVGVADLLLVILDWGPCSG